MANGDALVIGVTQPPDNRSTSATMLVHNGSVFGTQTTAFWVQRLGAPIATSAIRGDNFSTGPANGQVVSGVMGMVQPPSGSIGVLGAAVGQTNVMWGEIGVMGVTNTYGVVGQGLSGVLEEGGKIVLSSVGVLGTCDAGIGVQGVATSGFGIIGQSSARAGVTGTSVSGVGVEARSDDSHGLMAVARSGAGAFGTSTDGPGVVGQSLNGVGVQGVTDSGLAAVHAASSRGYGVFAESTQGVGMLSKCPTNAIQGVSDGPAATSIGVVGISTRGTGVQGSSAQSAGGWFTGSVGVVGDSSSGTGVVGRSVQGAAGLFLGDVLVQGSLKVTGAKSAAVRHADGSYRALFCLESAESMLQDFGEVVMGGTSVVVKLARDFAPLIRRDGYQVFLTSYGPDSVYVRRRTRQAFEVARVKGTTRGSAERMRVGYTIVARRADLAAGRLPRVRLPRALPRPAAPKVRRISRLPVAGEAVKVRPRPLPPGPRVVRPNLERLAGSVPRRSAASGRKPGP